MIFFLVMPGLFGGFGNYFIPIYIGSSEIIYPRINNFSILILFLSYLLIILSIILEFGSGTGWTLYPPLSTSFMNLEAVQLKYQSTMKSILIETDLCLVMCLVISIQIHFQVLISNS